MINDDWAIVIESGGSESYLRKDQILGHAVEPYLRTIKLTVWLGTHEVSFAVDYEGLTMFLRELHPGWES